MILFAFSVTLEMILLTLDILVRIGMFIWNYFKKKVKQPSKTFFEGSWIKEGKTVKKSETNNNDNNSNIFEGPLDQERDRRPIPKTKRLK